MTGTAVERRHDGAMAVAGDQERRWRQLTTVANVYANGTMVSQEMQGKPDVVLAGMLMCLRLGASEYAVDRIHVIEGKLEPPAELYLGAVHIAGFHTDVVRSDNETCIIEISRPGDQRPLTIEFSIDDARRAGFLDEWVEHWISFTDSRNQKRNKLEKFVLGREGVDIPTWAQDEIRAGKAKRMENWHRWPADMLFSKAAKRAVRRFAPEVLYGIAEDVQRASTTVSAAVDDSEIADGEIVPDPPRGDGAVEREGVPASAPPAPASLASDPAKRTLLRTIANLDDDHRARLKAAAMALPAEERFPRIDGDCFTVDHLARMLDLVDAMFVDADGEFGEARTLTRPSAEAEEVGGAGVEPQAGPAPTYTKGEEPFE